jgi:ADP-ribose pyrophosphatase YjhB (NUDIX family)
MAEPNHIEIIARGLIQDREWVLLCRDTANGYYYLPGGHVEAGEKAAAALQRELVEEAELHLEAGECMLICECCFEQDGKPRHEINLVFHVEPPRCSQGEQGNQDGGESLKNKGEPRVPEEIASCEEGIAFEWVELATLCDLDLRPTVIRAWVVSGGDLGDINRPGWISISE